MTRDDLDFLFLALTIVAALVGLPLTILEIVDKALDVRAKLRRAGRRHGRTTGRTAASTCRANPKAARRKG